jgi:superfamily II DNA or RNA helicase
MIKPRGWQVDALEVFTAKRQKSFLLDATPGSGKTIFSAFCFGRLIESKQADFVLAVVPTTALKGDKNSGFLGDYHKAGIQISPVLREGQGAPRDYQGAVTTYQQLPNLISTIRTWARNGLKLFVVFDEVHHLTESNVWGAAGEQLASCAVRILAMTGTPFRGDGQRISFINYDNDGKSVADHRYSYAQAVADGVCRAVEFMTDDGIAEFVNRQDDDEIYAEVRLSEAKSEDDMRNAGATIFRGDSPWLQTFITRADQCLDNYRKIYPSAGCLIVCRPGSDEADERHLRQVAAVTRRVTNHLPLVVSHDDAEANDIIAAYRNGAEKFICAVRKISEGVDIKRLHVLVMATRPTTELLFRQIVGRVVRVRDETEHAKVQEPATVYIPKFPQLMEWAARIRDEAKVGLREREKREPGEGGGGQGSSSFVPLGSSHESGGAISDFGDHFTAAEINTAEKLKQAPQLSGVPVTSIAFLLKAIGVEIDPAEPAGDPLHVQKKELRAEINTLARRLAFSRNAEQPDHKQVWIDLHGMIGVRDLNDLMDNYSIDKMRQARDLLKGWMGGRDAAA